MPLTKIRNWYGKYERPISSLSLVAGFVFDAVTLKRVDLFWENVWVIAHIVIVGVCIVLINALEKQEGDEANPSRLHFWLVNLQQFFYGGIWSTFLVFYFRSADLSVSWPFLLILALSFWANESLKRQFVRLFFQISLFFLAIFCFAIYLVPILLHKIGNEVFILSGLASIVFISLFLWLIWKTSGKKINEKKSILYTSLTGVFVLVNFLYFTNLIPPNLRQWKQIDS
jgi:cellulose synthase/poly-beta-1,6-N-acetylglucosamine synthase-like glycosyltransferase